MENGREGHKLEMILSHKPSHSRNCRCIEGEGWLGDAWKGLKMEIKSWIISNANNVNGFKMFD